jgi:integrase
VQVVQHWQNQLAATASHNLVMACRSILNRIMQAAKDDRRIPVNPVRLVPAPPPPIDPDKILGHVVRRAYTTEEFARLLATAPPFYHDHFIAQVGTGLRSGELLGLLPHRVYLDQHRLEVVDVRYEAGKFGSGYKNRPKTRASIRPVPLAPPSLRPSRVSSTAARRMGVSSQDRAAAMAYRVGSARSSPPTTTGGSTAAPRSGRNSPSWICTGRMIFAAPSPLSWRTVAFPPE